jgi:hypothetical protein
MDQPVGCRRPWEHARRVGRWGLTVLLVVWGLILADHACVVAAEQADRQAPKWLVGTGPFHDRASTPGVAWRAARHPHSWKPGLPYLAEYQARVLPEWPSGQRRPNGGEPKRETPGAWMASWCCAAAPSTSVARCPGRMT